MFSNFFSKYQHRLVFTIMTVGAAIGLLASFMLSVEAVTLARDANAVLPCDLNSALSCGAVGRHPTASIFGFPNAFIGLISFSVLLTVAVGGLMGARFPKIFMYLAWVGGIFGLIFAVWMFNVSYFVIGTLCPWCLTTDVATLMVVWALTRHNILEDHLYLPRRAAKTAIQGVKKNFDTVAFIAIAAIAVLVIVIKFGDQLF